MPVDLDILKVILDETFCTEFNISSRQYFPSGYWLHPYYLSYGDHIWYPIHQ